MKTLFCIVGKSGSGKTTIAEEMEKRYNLKQIQSYTTRSKRSEDETGHIFISLEDYVKDLNLQGRIVAKDIYNRNIYFTTCEQVNECDLYVVNPKGVQSLVKNYPIVNSWCSNEQTKKIITVYVKCGVVERYKRMRNRGDTVGGALKRIMYDCKDFKGFESCSNYILNNGRKSDLESVCRKLYSYIMKYNV